MPAVNVDVSQVLSQRASVNVASTLTVLWGPFNVLTFDSLAIEIQNPDVSQSIDCYVDIATAIAGPWAQQLWNGLLAVQPGETRADSFRKPGQQYVRLVAQASGAGVNNVIVTVGGVDHVLVQGQI